MSVPIGLQPERPLKESRKTALSPQISGILDVMTKHSERLAGWNMGSAVLITETSQADESMLDSIGKSRLPFMLEHGPIIKIDTRNVKRPSILKSFLMPELKQIAVELSRRGCEYTYGRMISFKTGQQYAYLHPSFSCLDNTPALYQAARPSTHGSAHHTPQISS